MKQQIKSRQKIAMLFILVFFGVILMKPAHFLFVDHHTHELTHTHSDEKSSTLHHDCDFCLFMLQAFTTQKNTELQQYFYTSFAELMQSQVQAWAYQFLSQISLRGPPLNGVV